ALARGELRALYGVIASLENPRRWLDARDAASNPLRSGIVGGEQPSKRMGRVFNSVIRRASTFLDTYALFPF
ncbi:MAG: hypothetical protein ACRD4P_13930, partial [Bryobacteraceae bacterium]